MIETFLENNEMYAQFFLFNNDMNNAGDPIKFKIYPDNNEKIAKSFIGRPYVLPAKDDKGNWINKHHRADSLDGIFNNQKKFSAGEIIAVRQNVETGNYNAIVKVFPEYYDTFKKGEIPEFTSPMFAHSDSWLDEAGQLHIKDGIGVHLQGVIAPGYSPELSSIKSICEAGLSQCMDELQIVAASGKLMELQSDESFSKEKITEDKLRMSQSSQQAPPAQADGQPDAESRLANVEKALAELTKQFQMILQKLGGQQQAPAVPPVGAAGTQVVEESEAIKAVRADLEQVKIKYETAQKEIEEEKQSLFMKERMRTATEIVEAKIKLHKLPLEAKDAEIKKLVELKQGENFVDLSLLHEELTKSVKAFVGASGPVQVYSIPELGATEENNADYVSIMESVH